MTKILPLLLLLGCEAPQVYLLQDGSRVICRELWPQSCGALLAGCEDGEEYYCQTNLRTEKKVKEPMYIPSKAQGVEEARRE